MTGIRIRVPETNELSTKTQQLLKAAPPLILNSMLAHADSTAAAISELTVQIFNGLQLTERQREIAILATANALGYEYIWVQHEALAADAGVSAEECNAIRRSDLVVQTFTGDEKALIRFADAVATAPTITDEIFSAADEHFTERQIVELLELVGLYWMFGRIVTVLQIPTEPPREHKVLTGIANMQSELANPRS
ncbi:carboxymuconolactone decarboxylase family protein [Mycobacterium syngnathidarum]